MSITTNAILLNAAGSDIENIILQAGTNAESGLTDAEAEIRLAKFGTNTIQAGKRKNTLVQLLLHFKSPLIIILLIATIISYSLGETVNASIILFIVVISVLIDFFQEKDASAAVEKLKAKVKSKVTVIRNTKETEMLPENLCPGDIILLNAGKIVPADARIIFARDFFVNQSSLTGESFPSEKSSDVISVVSNDLTALTNMVFMGSSVITGTAKAIVVQTGKSTAFGKIAEKLVMREEETDFSHGMREFGYLVTKVTVVLVLFIFLINSALKHQVLESFMFAIAVAVGLTPELLPMVMSVTMAKGSLKMAKKGVIVKSLQAIPNFGSMEVLCTDKTGTITEDKIKLIKCVTVEGKDSEALFLLAYLNSHFQTGIKNPLDNAILEYRQPDISGYIKKDEIPFDFSRKRMSVIVEHESNNLLICKGAPEEMLKISAHDATFTATANFTYESLSKDGFRVLAIATRILPNQPRYTKNEEQQLILQGFVAFLDPPKENVDKVIKELSAIGVEVKIITGDNHLVTQKICREIGLPVKGIIQGFELEHMTDEALHAKTLNTTIFSRFSPDQKNRVILSLKKHHHAVGYMGDGINDAPSLKTADIGISINNATDIAKDVADIILTRKDLLVLKEGIIEGRKTFGNTMKYILMCLSSNFGNMFSVAAATLFLPFLPMLPVQILINNFLYDTSQLAIPTDNVDESYVQQPQRWNMKVITRYMFIFGLTSSLFDLLTFYLLYKLFNVTEAQFRTGWFMESLATQILVVFIIRTNHLNLLKNKPGKYLVISTLLCLFVGWLLPYLPFATLLGFQPLPFHILFYMVIVIIIYLACAELVKRFIYQHLQKNHT